MHRRPAGHNGGRVPLVSALGRLGQQPAATVKKGLTYINIMPRLADARKEEMAAAIRAGRAPYRGAGNRTLLSVAAGANRRQNRYVVLADAAGRLTPAGEWYYAMTGAQRPRAAFSQDQELICRGGNDYIRTQNRREALMRSLRANGTTRITQLGRAFFRNRYREYVVHVPATIRGRHGNGRDYNRQDWLPVHNLGISGIMESEEYRDEQALARVRSRFLS